MRAISEEHVGLGNGRIRSRGFRSTVGSSLAAALLLSVLVGSCVPPPPEPVVGARMDPTLAGGFFSMPWPNDIRKAPDGTLDLSGLPGVDPLPGETPDFLRSLLPGIVSEIGSSLTGFGVNTAIYFDFDLGISESKLPKPAASTEPYSRVMLLDLDHPGERAPVVVDQLTAADRNRPNDLLSVLPYPGHPLRESNRYAVALFDGLETPEGQRFLPSPLIAALDGPWDPGSGVSEQDWNALRAQRDEVRSVASSTTDWSADDLLAFTVFTTQDVRGDVTAVADAVEARPAPAMSVDSQSACAPDPRAGGTSTSVLTGTIDLTRWQAGPYPYYEDGGAIEVGTDGLAVAQGTFAAEFSARVPCGEAPAGGWPFITYIDGSGGGWNLDATTLPFSYEGYAIAQIAPVYGVDRGVTVTPLMQSLGINSPQEASRFTFYNFFNPESVRTNTIQQTGENLELIAAMENWSLDGTALGTTGAVTVDPTRGVAAGHSQGSQSLPMVAASRPSLAAVVSSVSSGGLYHTLAHLRGNRELLGTLTGDATVLDELNPIVQVGQMMVEAGDGLNFPSDTNYLGYAGTADTCSPFENTRYFAGSTGLPIFYGSTPVSVYGAPALDPPRVSLPAQGNVDGRTRVAVELPGGHFVAFDQPSVTNSFLADVAAGATPTVPVGSFTTGYWSSLNCAGTRWDDPPTLFGR
ncbi:MAG: hypothetical protein R2716_13620 [Microthrixaceae bacterium]